jgi:hypothetical protein
MTEKKTQVGHWSPAHGGCTYLVGLLICEAIRCTSKAGIDHLPSVHRQGIKVIIGFYDYDIFLSV